MPPTPPQFMQNGLMRSPQGAPMAGAQYEQPQHAPMMMPPPPRHMQPPPQHYAMDHPQADMQWTEQHMPDQTSAATIGDHRAIDALLAEEPRGIPLSVTQLGGLSILVAE